MKPANAQFMVFSAYARHVIGGVDDVMDFARSLEDLAFPVLHTWRVSGLSGVPPGPDDAATADVLRIGESWREWKGWICTYLRAPEIAGLLGDRDWGTWRVQLDSDGLGPLFCDGRLIRDKVFLHGDLEVAPARPDGPLPWICYGLDTTIQPLLLEMGRCYLSGFEEANALIRDVARSLRAGASLLSTENRRINRFLRGGIDLDRSPLSGHERGSLAAQLVAAARQVDVRAFLEGERGRFFDSLRRCRDALRPIAEFAKRFTIFLLGVSHIDLAWKWRWPETIECMHGTLSDQFRLMGQCPDFTFLESSPPVWYALERKDPALWRKAREFARRGQFEPAGGMWCEPDCQMLSAESWVRQMLHGQRAAVEHMDRRSRAGHNTDAFGFTWALPKMLAAGGMEAFLTQKLRYNLFTIFKEVIFWWESDDGSRVLGIHTYPDHYQEIDPDELAEAARVFFLSSGLYSSAILFGIGNHGGGPQPDMFDRIEAMKRLTVYPNVRMAGMNAYLDHIKSREADALARLPVLRDEMFLECHHKTFTVQARVKAANRRAERDLLLAEAAQVCAGVPDVEDLRDAWCKTLFNQFHDILPGTSFPMVYQDVYDDYDSVFRDAAAVRDEAACALADPGGPGFTLLNQLLWRRNAAVRLCADGLAGAKALRDSAGRDMPCQPTGERPDEVVFVARDLPALGLEHVAPHPRERSRTAAGLRHGDTWAENRFFRVEFDPERGVIRSLKLADGTELAGDGIGRLDLLEDTPEGYYQTWNMNLTGREDPARCDAFELAEAGPVRVRFQARLSFGRWEKKKDFMVPIMWNTPGVDYPTSFFVHDFAIYAELPWVECTLRADWWEDDTDLKVAADTLLEATRAFYSIPFGCIERPTSRTTPREKGMYEVPALAWADITDGTHGLAVFNTGRHGHDALGGRLRLTLLTSPYGGEKVHVPDPLADRGRHEIHYAFFPHAGGPHQARLARVSMDYEHAPLVVKGAPRGVAAGNDGLLLADDRLAFSAVKPAEDGQGIIVRIFESTGETVPLELSGRLAGQARAVNFLEDDGGDPPRHLRPHQVVSLRLTGQPSPQRTTARRRKSP